MTDSASKPQEPSTKRDSLGICLLALLAVLLVAAWGFGMSTERPSPPGLGPVFMGLFLLVLGGMFWASYFIATRSPVLGWLLNFASGWPGAKTPKMAFLWALVAFISGVGAITAGLGIPLL